MASAGCVDAPSVKGADTVAAAVRGFDAGKKVNGRKRHVVVDTMGLLLLVLITSASVQDRDGARTLLDRVKMAMPSLSLLWADGGYAGRLVEWAEAVAHITVEIVRKPLGIRMFQVLPRRWVVERTFAWIVKCRRLNHDYERLPETSEAMIKWAMIGLMVRRLEPPPGRKPWQRASTDDTTEGQPTFNPRRFSAPVQRPRGGLKVGPSSGQGVLAEAALDVERSYRRCWIGRCCRDRFQSCSASAP